MKYDKGESVSSGGLGRKQWTCDATNNCVYKNNF